MEEFATAFENADSLFVLDIYAASEPPIEGVTGESLARLISEKGKQRSPVCRFVCRWSGGGGGGGPDRET